MAGGPRFPQVPWQVGQWAAYQIEGSDGMRRFVDLAIVGKQRIKGQSYFWCELKGNEGGRKVILRQLISKNRQSVRDVFVQKEGQAPIALRKGSHVRLDGGEGFHTFFEWMAKSPSERTQLSVFAGHFQAYHSSMGEDRFWFSGKVPILGLVQANTSRLGKMILMAYGLHGARSVMTGSPKSIKMPRLGNALGQ